MGRMKWLVFVTIGIASYLPTSALATCICVKGIKPCIVKVGAGHDCGESSPQEWCNKKCEKGGCYKVEDINAAPPAPPAGFDNLLSDYYYLGLFQGLEMPGNEDCSVDSLRK